MAMNGNKLGTDIANAIIHADAPPEVKAEVIKLWQIIAGEIVSHIQQNAQVPPGIAVTTPAGPGATSAPGSVT